MIIFIFTRKTEMGAALKTPVTQDIVLVLAPPRFTYDNSWKGANMALNRFCIDEEMANESSGVFYGQRFASVGKVSHFN